MGKRDTDSALGQEMSVGSFGDSRLSRRLGQMVELLEKLPNRSIPEAMGGLSEAEAAYRFLRNEQVTPQRILEPHWRASVERMRAEGVALVVHDTTEMRFRGQREGLGDLGSKIYQGFFCHLALAVDARGNRRPLGVLGVQALVRRQRHGGKKRKWRERRVASDRESLRWGALLDLVEERVAGRCSMIHLMDREADDYELFAGMVTKDRRFVVRMHYDRRLQGEPAEALGPRKVQPALDLVEDVADREVVLSARQAKHPGRPRASGEAPVRRSRVARLKFRSTRLCIARPQDAPNDLPPSLELNVVRVQEIEPPDGQEPVLWTLVTTEPVSTPEQVLGVVDYYRCRWMIEEYFKVLKTGCAYESRQLESLDTLLNFLAIVVPVAWQMFALRSLADVSPQAPATDVLTDDQVAVLTKIARPAIPTKPTAHQALYAIAALGGHFKRNGPPGWLVLRRGFEKLDGIVEGYCLAVRGCDQS